MRSGCFTDSEGRTVCQVTELIIHSFFLSVTSARICTRALPQSGGVHDGIIKRCYFWLALVAHKHPHTEFIKPLCVFQLTEEPPRDQVTDPSVRDLDQAEGQCVCLHMLESHQIDFDLWGVLFFFFIFFFLELQVY